ncbi:general stress protein [uncultured Microbacterium sp.]|uniref:general stress protein n=1 Tax=uncultured Microbacterium sp. TaxID=191216 RepID=UPI0025E97F13|nr:general stress protein [uncultured Microbacterium sp.]
MLGGIPQEHGEKIADFATYPAAQKAVSQLVEADIPARDIAIVGHGLRSVETVTGRLGYAAAARSGAVNGILLGLLFSAIFVLGTPNAAIQLFIGVMLVGIALGMLMSIITYSIVRRRRDYTSITQVLADRYEVTVLPRSIHRAREVVGRTVTPAAAHRAPSAPVSAPAPDTSAPPQYGERVDPPQYGERLAPPVEAPTQPSAPPAGDAGVRDGGEQGLTTPER